EHRAVGEIDDAQDGEDQREAESEDRVDAADGQAVEDLLDKQRARHGGARRGAMGTVLRPARAPMATGVSPRSAPGPALLLEEDEGALGAVRLHLDLRDVEVLLDDLPARRGLEGDLAEGRLVAAGDDLLVQLGAELRQVHARERRLLVQRAEGVD